jgi:hypothetical protein
MKQCQDSQPVGFAGYRSVPPTFQSASPPIRTSALQQVTGAWRRGLTGRLTPFSLIIGAALLALAAGPVLAAQPHGITLSPIGTYASGVYAQGGAEIVAHDPATQRLYVVNGGALALDVLDISEPTLPALVASVDFSAVGDGPTSVACREGVVAVAVPNSVKTSPGTVLLFDRDLNPLSAVTVGALPDMLTVTPNGRYVLVANEGEPNSYGQVNSLDPEGSVSIIDLSGGAAHVTQADVHAADFTAWDGRE